MPRTKRGKGVSFDNFADQSDSRLMALPAELRNDIYELSLPDSITFPRRKKENRKGYAKVPGFLIACKHIYHEAKPIYYATTTMYFTVEYRLLVWLKHRKPEEEKALQSVTLGAEFEEPCGNNSVGRRFSSD